MTKLKNTLNILNVNSKLFHEWKTLSNTEVVLAKFFFEGAEIAVSEWLNCLDENCSPETQYAAGGGASLALEMDNSYSIAELIYKAFISEFNIAYNLAEGE